MSDRRTAGNSATGAFTALQYSADGSLLFAGGSSKWVCVYDTAERVLLQRFQLSKNLALDGVLDQLNSKNLTDAGPLDLLDVQDDAEDQKILPVATPGSVSGAEKLPGAPPLLRYRHCALPLVGCDIAHRTSSCSLSFTTLNAKNIHFYVRPIFHFCMLSLCFVSDACLRTGAYQCEL